MRKYNNRFLNLIIIIGVFTSCKLSRFVFYNFADIKDYRIFPTRTLQNDSTKFIFQTAINKLSPKLITTANYIKLSFDRYLENNKTVAFLIIHNDIIQYEKYFKGYDRTSIVPSFSMAKSITSILIGCAIDDGFIKSVEEPITNYIPQLKNGLNKVTIRNLLQMTSGIDFNESYTNPFGDAGTFYYGRNLKKKLYKLKLRSEPNKKFQYISGGTQLLGLILENALKTKTVSEYLQEKIWKPLGMEYNASWSIDQKKNGMEKIFCCINARARDFAKIGRLYLNNGNWNGKQIVSANWVKESTKTDTTNGGAWFYKYQWWLPSENGDFMAEGILGQFIYVNPLKNLIIVRLGKKYGNINWGNFFTSIASNY